MVFHGKPNPRWFNCRFETDEHRREEARKQALSILQDARVGDWMEAAWGWAFKVYDQPHPDQEVTIHVFFA